MTMIFNDLWMPGNRYTTASAVARELDKKADCCPCVESAPSYITTLSEMFGRLLDTLAEERAITSEQAAAVIGYDWSPSASDGS